MIRILVTGSNGQLGQSIKEIAKEYKSLSFVFETSKTFDITNNGSAENIFLEGHFEYCINCAAYTNVNEAEEHPEAAFKVNAEGVKNLALACQKYQVILIHISTDYVFDGTKETGYTVHDIPSPINIYGKSKLAGERYIEAAMHNYFIIRTSWLYSKYGNNFYKTILEKAKTEKTLYVTDEQTGCPTNAVNLADYICQLIVSENNNFGIHHFTDGEAMTWHGFANQILRKNNLLHAVKVVKGSISRSLVQRPKNSVLL